MDYELKLCPMCGGEAKYRGEYVNKWEYFTFCPSCGLKTRIFDNPDDAQKAWNNRANCEELIAHVLAGKILQCLKSIKSDLTNDIT